MQWAAIFISASENTKLLLQVFLYQAEQFAWTKLTDIGMHESCKTNKILQAYIFEQELQENCSQMGINNSCKKNPASM